MPNWFIHDKWSNKLGVDSLISSVVNRFIDYAGNYGLYDKKKNLYNDVDDPAILRQLKFFYQKDLEKKFSSENLYVKTYFLHHLLDYFRETRHNINDIELVLKKFLEEKVPIGFSDKNGKKYNFKTEIDEVFRLIRENIQELYDDMKNKY
jgi:hypothetical protein